MVEVTGTLKNWVKQYYNENDYVYYGNLYNDIRNRWWEGVSIRTSLVVKEEDGLVYTLNSVYKLEDN